MLAWLLGAKPLWEWCSYGDLDKVRALLGQGEDVNGKSAEGGTGLIFAVKKHHNSGMIFSPSVPGVDLIVFPPEDWGYSIYLAPGKELKEVVPPNMPPPLDKQFVLGVHVDVNHSEKSLT